MFGVSPRNRRLPNRKQLLRGQYENKIRMEATFTKVFETFASKIENDELVMDYFDLLRSICNFCYSTRKTQETFDLSQRLLSKSKIAELFDLDRSQSFSIYEVGRPVTASSC